jgi:hypothetical protein
VKAPATTQFKNSIRAACLAAALLCGSALHVSAATPQQAQPATPTKPGGVVPPVAWTNTTTIQTPKVLPGVDPQLGPNGRGTPPAKWEGGRVQHHPQVYILFWGPTWSSNTGPLGAAMDLFQHTSGNGWTNILAQYYDNVDQIHPDAHLAGSWQTNDATPCINPSNLETEIQNAAAVRGWSQGPDSQFIVWPQPGACITYTAFPGIPNNGCGWHGVTPTSSLVYAMVPWNGDTGCATQYSHNAAMTGITSHEYVEAASDPTGQATPASPAWTDSTGGYEIGDLCENWGFTPGPNGEYVAYIWSNRDNQCVSSFSINYASQYVGQHDYGTSYPYMAREHAYPWWVQVRNTGNVPWGVGSWGQVRLGTTSSTNRCSAFADGSWMSCGRIAVSKNISTGDTTPIQPGQTAEFDFNMTPSPGLAPGNYTENFQVVAENYAWIGGGIWWALTVGSLGGGYVTQTNTVANVAVAGLTYVVDVTFQNTGSCPWFGADGVVRLATSHPHYRGSAFQAATWPASYIATSMSATEVDPGGTYTFQYEITVPTGQTPGSYQEYFDLDAAYIGYFTDSNYNLPLTVV